MKRKSIRKRRLTEEEEERRVEEERQRGEVRAGSRRRWRKEWRLSRFFGKQLQQTLSFGEISKGGH